MTKRRTPPTTTSSTRKTTTDELTEFSNGLRVLMDHYLERGCPCRFPRFRAHEARETSELGAPGFTTWEQQALMQLFDQLVPLVDKVKKSLGHEGNCSICGAHIERWGEERFRDAWLEHMRITPKEGVADLGARVPAPVPRASQFFLVGPRHHDDNERLAEIHFPKLSAADWFAYMRELA